MSIINVISLACAMIVLAASPGPGVFATVSRAMVSGFGASVVLICGIVLGDIVYLLLASFGMTLVAYTMKELFVIVKICGGVYLVWLGYKAWTQETVDSPDATTTTISHAGCFASGLVITLSNPKVIVFYCGFLPTFIDLTSVSTGGIVTMIAVIAVVLSGVLGTYAWIAVRTRRLIAGEKAVKGLNRASGAVMAATGVFIAVKS